MTKTHARTKSQSTTKAPRNPVARAPIMRKGGAHQNAKSPARASEERITRTASSNWRDDVSFEKTLKDRD
ncbi:hypothetical protein [Arenicella xantha]|uniref:Uncharacterized protein n=1 Tax=Arenicella xantha TaxID=644221 RepID=A0A395JPB1_9GAMM|nr:hypothetical protein [Arenicella xantha]RBP53183.1 hypothetical protein DFR28_101568 [Arenicella xantha]